MADHKPVDSAQIVLDKRGPSPASGGAQCSASSGLGCVALKVFAVAFVVCNVTALYVLHFVNRPTPSTALSTSNFVATAGTEPTKGDVVSMAYDNTMRNGAGTTAYLSRTTIVEDNSDFFEYVNLAKLGVSKAYYTTNLLSYRCRRPFGSKNVSVLTTATYDPLSKSVKISSDYDATKNVIDDDAIRGVVTLSDSQALILTVDDATFSTKTYVMPAAISGGKATLDQSKKVKVTEDSSTNFATRLSDTTAVVAYYELYDMTNNYFQYVKVAKVAADGTVTLSASTKFGPANNIPSKVFTTFGKPVALPSKDGAFAIPYYLASSNAASKSQETGLCVTMATYASNAVGTFTTGVCNTNFRPAFYPEAVMLTDSIMLIAFHDDANNNALTLTTLHVTATTAHFRSVYVFPEVAGPFVFGSGYGFSPEISLALLSGNRVAVSFLNPSMDGKQSVKVLKYSTETLTFKDATPVLPISTSSFTLDDKGGAEDKSVTQQVLAVTDDSVVAMYVGKRGDAAQQHVSVVEVFGAPVGVLRSIKGSDADVVLSGKAKDVRKMAKLNVGKTYYATTMGYAVTPATSAAPGAEYFTISDDVNVMVTTDSKIGVAVDDDALFVSTAQ